MAEFLIDSAMKSVLWEEAKGKLRALVAMQGSYVSAKEDETHFEDAQIAVDEFIDDFEGRGLYE